MFGRWFGRCHCFAKFRKPAHIAAYIVADDGTVWCVCRRCPVHDIEPIEVVWIPFNETAADCAVAVQR